MIRSTPTVLLCLALAALFYGCKTHQPELARLNNAGFELPLDSGWVQTIVDDSVTGLQGWGLIERSDTLGQPGSGFAVRVYRLYRERASLSQTVGLETLAQVVGFDARFRIGGFALAVPAATVALDYLDGAGSRLGRTLFYLSSSYSPWTGSDSLHLIRIADTTGAWSRYSLNLQAELDSSLPLVDQSRVRKLRIELSASVDYYS